MHLLPTEEQKEIVASVAKMVDAKLPFERLFGGRHDHRPVVDAIWAECAQSGWFGLSLPLDQGGAGCSVVEEMLVQRELAARLAPLSMLATPLAARLALAAGEAALARDLAEGRRRAGFAIRMADELLFLEGEACDLALTLKSGRMDLREFGARARRTRAGCLDPTLTAVLVDTGGRAVETVAITYDQGVLDHARVLVAAHLTAIGERARDLAVDYAKTRQQFGRPIGGFQAIKHRCSDMAVRCEAAYAQSCVAAAALRDGAEDLDLHLASVWVVAREAALENARASAQIHGGVGMTEEHVAHLLIKRAHVLESLGDNGGAWRALLAA